MNPTHSIRVSADIAAPPALIWERVSDHEATPGWVSAVKRVSLSRPGTAKNGLGAIRVVEFKPLLWSTIHEEITLFETPRAFHYVLFKGMPGLAGHIGKVIVDDLGGGRSRLRWEVDFKFKTIHPFRLVVPTFLREFEGVLGEAVLELKRQLETSGQTG